MANTAVKRTLAAQSGFTITGFPLNAFAITASDTAIYVDVATAGQATTPAVPVSVYVGTGGNIKVTPFGGLDADAVTFTNFPAGEMLPLQVQKVWSTGTTASNLVGVC